MAYFNSSLSVEGFQMEFRINGKLETNYGAGLGLEA